MSPPQVRWSQKMTILSVAKLKIQDFSVIIERFFIPYKVSTTIYPYMLSMNLMAILLTLATIAQPESLLDVYYFMLIYAYHLYISE